MANVISHEALTRAFDSLYKSKTPTKKPNLITNRALEINQEEIVKGNGEAAVDTALIIKDIVTMVNTPVNKVSVPLDKRSASERKQYPIGTGVIDYFPLAIAEVAHVSFKGNEQHNPGKKLHWDRSKSGDEADALMRHFIDRGKFDIDGLRHSAKVAWRALALLQKEIEAEKV